MIKEFLFSHRKRSRKLSLMSRTLALMGALLWFAAGAANATTFTVHVSNFKFTPAFLSLQAGDTVQWVWDDSGHSSTSGTPDHPDGIWDSDILDLGDTFSFTFTNAGSFSYYCSPHGSCCNMIGTITVA